jgi:hypothetical protein
MKAIVVVVGDVKDVKILDTLVEVGRTYERVEK